MDEECYRRGVAQIQSVDDTVTGLQPLPTGATPSVANLKTVSTNNGGATSITSFTNGFAAQEIILVGRDGGNTTVVHGTNIRCLGGANFVLGDNDTMHLVSYNGTVFVEINRSNNTCDAMTYLSESGPHR